MSWYEQLEAIEAQLAPRRVPKPSAGDLERGVVSCRRCERSMGPADSTVHDLRASEEDKTLCEECAEG